jgi:hypothetical protein
VFWKENNVFDVRRVECWFLVGSDLCNSEVRGDAASGQGELRREVRNGKRSPEMVWRKEEGMGLSRQVVRPPDLTSCRISSGERRVKEVKA